MILNFKKYNESLIAKLAGGTNFEIKFEDEDLIKNHKGSTNWYWGDVTIGPDTYPFTLCEMWDKNSDSTSYDITWVEETPINSEELESDILDKLEEIRSEINEKLVKRGDNWVVYPKAGGKRLGSHKSRTKALKQLAAIEISKNKK